MGEGFMNNLFHAAWVSDMADNARDHLIPDDASRRCMTFRVNQR